jgi:thioredoxin reductase
MYDTIIIGGGPAGLSAALVLGRCRRRVLVCDSGRYRNDASRAMHGFLSRDGIHPAELRRIGREQLKPYGVELRNVLVTDARKLDNGFEVTLATGEQPRCRKLLLATGLVDTLPEIAGLTDLYGRSVFHCPYCDGWEARDQPIAVYGTGCDGVQLARTLRTWSRDVALCTDGPAGLDKEDESSLERLGVTLREERITRLEGVDGMLRRVVFEGGGSLPRSVLFLKCAQAQRSDLARKLRLPVSEERGVEKGGKHEETYMKGVFVAGDASKDLLLAVVAAAEGAEAAFGINCELQEEDQQR